MLFKGNLRRNLDPVNKHEDSSLWNVLKDVSFHPSSSQFTFALAYSINYVTSRTLPRDWKKEFMN